MILPPEHPVMLSQGMSVLTSLFWQNQPWQRPLFKHAWVLWLIMTVEQWYKLAWFLRYTGCTQPAMHLCFFFVVTLLWNWIKRLSLLSFETFSYNILLLNVIDILPHHLIYSCIKIGIVRTQHVFWNLASEFSGKWIFYLHFIFRFVQ